MNGCSKISGAISRYALLIGFFTFFSSQSLAIAQHGEGEPVNASAARSQQPAEANHLLPAGQVPAPRKNPAWTVAEGRVTFTSVQSNHLEFELSSGGDVIQVQAGVANDLMPSLFEGGLVRVSGDRQMALNLQGDQIYCRLVVGGMADIEPLELLPEKWLAHPIDTIRHITDTATNPFELHLVHAAGKVQDTSNNSCFLLADNSGAMWVRTAQVLPETGDMVEVLGYGFPESTGPLVVRCVYHPKRLVSDGNKLPVLNTVEQVRHLTASRAKLAFPVRLRGVITARDIKGSDQVGVIQDATAPVYVWLKSPAGRAIQVGHFCEVAGVTEAGGFAPTISERSLTDLGPGVFPKPLHPTYSELVGGSLDCDWVELEGILRPTGPIGLRLMMKGGHVNLRVGDLQNSNELANCFNAMVKVRGCVFPYRSSDAKVTGSALVLTPSTLFISVARSAPDLFGVPLSRAADLLRFQSPIASLSWVRLAGQVVYARDGTVFLLDGTDGARCLLQESQSPVVAPGDLVEVVGLNEAGQPSPLLRDAILRKTGHAALPVPRRAKVADIFPIRQEGSNVEQAAESVRDTMRVQLEGRLVSIRTLGGNIILEIQSGLRVFEAVLPQDGGAIHQLPPLGSRLAIRGVVASLQPSLDGRSDEFELLLNSPADITCLELPPRWTLRETLILAAGLMVVVFLSALWIVLLRHRVEQRTRQLRTEMEERRHAEHRVQQLEMQAVVENERIRIARDIHDDLGARVTRISFLAVAATDPGRSQESMQRLLEIRSASQQLIRALDETVWTVNPGNDSLANLLDYITHFAEEFFRDTHVHCQLKLPVDFQDQPMSAELRYGLLAIVKETLNNALKHSGAATVVVTAGIADGMLSLVIEDDGRGFSREKPADGNGLANLRSRARDMGARLEISSHPSRGTTVRVELSLVDRGSNVAI